MDRINDNIGHIKGKVEKQVMNVLQFIKYVHQKGKASVLKGGSKSETQTLKELLSRKLNYENEYQPVPYYAQRQLINPGPGAYNNYGMIQNHEQDFNTMKEPMSHP